MKKFIYIKRNQSLLWVTFLITLWEIVPRFGAVNVYLLPPFSSVMKTLAEELLFGKLGIQTLNSLLIITAGFGFSFILAVGITALCSAFPIVESLFNTLSTIMNPLPAVAVMPLVIMWFGINTGAMLVIIIHGVLWALTRHLLDGLHSVSPIYKEWGRNIDLPVWYMFTDIIVFAIMPEFLAGFRIGWGRAWRALISAEMAFGMIGAVGGLGHYIYMGRAYARIMEVFAGIVVVATIGILVESLLFGQIEKSTIRKWGMTHE